MFACSYRRALDVEQNHVSVMSNYAFLMLGGAKLSSRHTITANPQASDGSGVSVAVWGEGVRGLRFGPCG